MVSEVKDMGAELLNLNEPPAKDVARYVMLQKDKKPICRTKCSNLPFAAPSLWTISEFKPSAKYWKLDLPRCLLYPEHENSYQKREWGIFLHFLWKNKKAGIVKSECSTFYILAPDEYPQFTYAIVPYQIGKGRHTSCDQEVVATSGEILNEPRNFSYSEDLIQKSCVSVHLQQTNRAPTYVLNSGKLPSSEERDTNCQDSRDYFRGTIVDNVCVNDRTSDNQHTSISFQKRNNSGDLKFRQMALDSIPPRESVVEYPCRSQPISAMMDDVIKRNFVRTNPSYLQTLSQTHSGWIFGAIAELVDNSRDADATRLDIKIESMYSKKAGDKTPVLSILDDGHGMSHPDIVRMLSFGHKTVDGEDSNRIGRFGIGFKTGAMRLGKDAIILTQTSCSRSVALLSQSYNENKDNLEVPIITYRKQGNYMELDSSIQSEECANSLLKSIKEVSPFNEYFIGEKFGLFGEMGTGTQVYIWNLDKWGSDYSLEWGSDKNAEHALHEDILIRSRRLKSRQGQISQKVPLDYSLHAYLEVIFLDPRMKIYVQGSLVRSRPLAKYLNKTVAVKGHLMGKAVHLTLGRSQLEWDRMNCGMFLYWHGRLIEAYKRVGGSVHNADMGRGVIGVIDVTSIMDDGNGHAWVLNSKQGFQDCEAYVNLEEWLGKKMDEYWDDNFDTLVLIRGDESLKSDHEWVQCNKCRKWRILPDGFETESLPLEWFCYMQPFSGKCEIPEEEVGHGIITVGLKRSGYTSEPNVIQHEEKIPKYIWSHYVNQHARNNYTAKHEKAKQYTSASMKIESACDGSSGDDLPETTDHVVQPVLKRIRRGPSRCSKQK